MEEETNPHGPITQQPSWSQNMEMKWMSRPGGSQEGVPQGWEALDGLEYLRIVQNVDFDMRGRCGTGNTYSVKNQENEHVFTAVEETTCCCRCCCGPARKFHLILYDDKYEPVANLDRAACRCDCCCCFDCCMGVHKVIVRDNMAMLVGQVKQKFHIFSTRLLASRFTDNSATDEEAVGWITGPCCPCRCNTDLEFEILSSSKDVVTGNILKRWDGNSAALNNDHENFEIYFPNGSSAVDKMLLLTGVFLVDFMYMEMS